MKATINRRAATVNFSETAEGNQLIRTWSVEHGGKTYGAQQFIERAEGDNTPITPTPQPEVPQPKPEEPKPVVPTPTPQPEQPKVVKVQEITLSSLTPTATVGDEVMVSAKVAPETATNQQLKWTFSPTNALKTTNTEGNFIAQSAAMVTIHVEATDGSGISANYQVKIQPKKVQKITLDAAKKELYPNESFTLKAVVTPNDATNRDLTWTVVDGDAVKVSPTGVVTAIKVGSATVRAVAADGSGKFAECNIVVAARKVQSITLNEQTKTLLPQESFQLTAKVAPENATNTAVKWEVTQGKDVISISENGLITALKVGSATVRAISADGSGVVATCQVVVNARPVASITLNEQTKTLLPQETFQLTAKVAPDNATNTAVKWEVTQGNDVISISENGLITALKVGSATVRATAADGSGKFAECKVVVNARPVASITLNKQTKTLLPQESFQLTAKVTPENATNTAVKWEVPQGNDVVSIAQDGTITALKVGSATVRAIAADGSGVVAECKVTVQPRKVQRITISAPTTPIYRGGVLAVCDRAAHQCDFHRDYLENQ